MPDGRKIFRLLTRMDEGVLPPELIELVLAVQLGEGCPACREALQPIGQEERRLTLARPLVRAWCRTDASTAALVEDASHRLRTLWRLSDWAERFSVVDRSRTAYRSPALVALLLAESRIRVQGDPFEAERYAALATTVAEKGKAGALPSCRAAALAYRGNAHRAAGDLTTGERLLGEARRLLEFSESPPWIVADVASLTGSLLKDRRQLTEATNILLRAIAGFRLAGDRATAARTRLTLAATYRAMGEQTLALRAVREAIPELAAHSDIQLSLLAFHNLAVYLCDSKDVRAAAAIVEALAPVYDLFPDRHTTLRRRWLEGLIARDSGRIDAAESLLKRVVEDYITDSAAFPAAMAGLDLAQLYLDVGECHGKLLRLAEILVKCFQELGVHREATAALLLLSRAALERRVSLELLMQLRAFLDESRLDQQARFQT